MIENIDMTDVAKGFDAAYARGKRDGLIEAADYILNTLGTIGPTHAKALRDMADKLKEAK